VLSQYLRQLILLLVDRGNKICGTKTARSSPMGDVNAKLEQAAL
jgi:hypothetical protein